MDQQRVEEKNEKEEQSEESESVTDRSEEEMSDMTIAFEWDKESAKNDDAKTYGPACMNSLSECILWSRTMLRPQANYARRI